MGEEGIFFIRLKSEYHVSQCGSDDIFVREDPNRGAVMTKFSRCFILSLAAALLFLIPSMLQAADVTNPDQVTGLMVTRDGDDLILTWNEVISDATGNPESVDHYDIYRGEFPDFIPDKAGKTNRIGISATPSYIDSAAALGETDYFYLVNAVDISGNEGITKEPVVTVLPVLSGYWTDTSIELDWSDALPSGQVQAYKVYYGKTPHTYEASVNVGLVNHSSLVGLDLNTFYYCAVTAVDLNGNEAAFSNEHVDCVAGRADLRAQDAAGLCWLGGGQSCPPAPGEIQRSGGFQNLHPVHFPGGDWTKVTVTFTMESRLCDDPIAPDKCGQNNPGWNPCGDPWDRTAHLFLVLDDCVELGGSCITNNNIELMRAITPFGTDAPPPDGSGDVPPRALTLDITPFAPLLVGDRYIGTEIGNYAAAGWWVTVDFHFNKRTDEASPKKPAVGFKPLFFHSSSSGLVGPFTVSVPAEAQQVFGRLFITGHGGNSDPGCGQPADEFCPRINRILVDSDVAWEHTPWRDCCYPRGTEPLCLGCTDWNACGWPSCTYDRSGWCPGEIACHKNIDQGCDQDLDLTLALVPGGTYDVEYQIVGINGTWSRSFVAYWYNEYIGYCGNNVREESEVCDGTDLAGQTCQSLGFDAGTLACNVNCDGFNTSGCRFYECGNHICELSAGEDCLSCPTDCNGEQSGSPQKKYCCGDGDGVNPVNCSDLRCTANGNTCEP